MAVTSVKLEQAPAKKVHRVEGIGAQLNTNLFVRGGQFVDLSSNQRRELEGAIRNLKLGHSRIFVLKDLRPETAQGRAKPQFQALMKTIELVHHAAPHATVNLTWWQGPYGTPEKLAALKWPNAKVEDWPHSGLQKWPDELTNPAHKRAITAPRVMMRRFARIVEEARRQFPCVTHVTIQNEPNGEGHDLARKGNPGLSRRLYELLYRHLDAELKKIPDPQRPSRKLRQAITIVAGDLVDRPKAPRNNQDVWLKYIHANMERPRTGFPSVVDAYSIHVYWDPTRNIGEGFPKKLEGRLRRLVGTIRNLPSDLPIYVTEYGVKLQKAKLEPGTLDRVTLEKHPRVAFQHAWFNALAPQCGTAGLAKWVLYRTEPPPRGWGNWGMLDSPSQQFERTPVYRVTRFFNHVVPSGWRAAGFGPQADKKDILVSGNILVSRFAAPNGVDNSVVVLNSTPDRQDVQVHGLTKNRAYHGAVWNRDGNGRNQPLDPVRTGADGTAVVHDVPPHGVVGLSTLPLNLF